MPAGTYHFKSVLYPQFGQLVTPDAGCLGKFEIKPNKLNYVGDIFLTVGK
jgi:hypothetical protein